MRYKKTWSEETKMALAKKRYGNLSGFVTNYRRLHRGRLPWAKTYLNMVARCTNKKEPKYKYYGGKGIRALLSIDDVKDLYFQYNAWAMDVPSLDRKDSTKDYTKSNCRFIEFSENRKLRHYGS